MSEKSITFATEYEEPTALAFTDFTKPSPILKGEYAENFLKNMEEAERRAEERAKKPMTIDEAKRLLSFNKFMLDYENGKVEEIKKEIKKLESIINKSV